MKVAILEICTHTHYTVTNGLIKTYSTNPQNSIVVYTTDLIAKTIQEGGVPKNTTLVVFDKAKKSATQFLTEIENTPLDRLHICTIEDYYDEFSKFKPNVKNIFFHVHEVDTWFSNSFKNSFKNFIFNMRYMPDKVREVPRFLREAWVRSPARSRILANIQTKKPYYIVLSPGLKTYLSQFVEDKSIIVFPGAINEGIEKPPMSCTPNGKTRICIPGIVTDTRRDYSGLFEILESILPDIKHKLIFDFLGFIEKRELNLLSKIQHLEQQGLEVFYSTDFVKAKKFDEDLDKADVLLNNQNVAVSRSGKYGVAKETGMLYNMVRGAKPAIYPYGYPIDKQFEEILLYYNSTEALKNIILGLANGQIPIEKYKAKAVEMAHNFTPHNLYGRLVNDGVEVP